MSQRTRLGKLETAVVDPARAGRRCPACAGLDIADAMNAHDVLERGNDRGETKTPAWARGVLDALEAGTVRCELCGLRTLAGALAELDAIPDDPE